MGYSPWGCKESNPTQQLPLQVAQRLKGLPPMQETRVRSLGREDSLERKGQPTPVFLTGESHGRRSLVGYSPWGRKELDTTERLHFHFQATGYKTDKMEEAS